MAEDHPLLPEGFVVAMQGRLVLEGSTRGRRTTAAWFIVSRFAPAGRMLAIGLAGPLPGPPRRTVLGQACAHHPAGGAAFRLLVLPVPRLLLAGRWRASRGAAVLAGAVPALRLAACGRAAGGLRWRLRAVQRPWVGEWWQPPSPHEGLTLG